MSSGDGTHNENKGSVGGPLIQSRDIYGGVTLERDSPADEALAQDLAGLVRLRSREEEEHWRIGDPAPLQVRWHEADAALLDDWENIHRDQEQHDPVPLSGQFTAIRETFQTTGSQRLVVLGRAGAGKTVLAHRLILDLLDTRDRRGPVPVLFSLNDWNPTASGLRDWMIERLVRDFPFLTNRDIDATGKRGAEVLVDGDWVLPVLDGFDELPDRHHHAAIRQISQVQLPLLLTSRPDEYARAAAAADVIGRAAAVKIEDLTLDQAQRYLCRTAGPSRVAEWQEVFEYLRNAPVQAASQNLISVLTTPLMVMFARTRYEDTSENHPRELLDAVHFPTDTDLQRHLLSGYVSTVYDSRRALHPPTPKLPTWNQEQARHWLGYLATRLQTHGTHDLMWWQLPVLLTRRTRILATSTMFGLSIGLVDGLLFWFMDMSSWTMIGLVPRLAFASAVGFALGLFNEVNLSRGRAGHEPERLHLFGRGRRRRRGRFGRAFLKKAASEFINGLAFGIAVGLVFWLVWVLEDTFMGVFGGGLMDGLGGGLPVVHMLGLVGGLVGGLTGGLAGGNSVGLAGGLSVGLAVGFVFWWAYDMGGLAGGPVAGFLGGLVGGLVGGLANRLVSRHLGRFAGWLVGWLAGGLASWLAGVLAGGVTGWLAGELMYGLMYGLPGATEAWVGLTLGFMIGLANVLVSVLGEGLDPHDSDPWQLLAIDRTVTLTRTIPMGLLVMMSASSLLDGGLATGISFVWFIAVPRLARSAWGNWLLFARLWLPLTGRLPWRPKRFLEDAHQRGILRRAGAAYQFRHAQLRDHLAQHHPRPPS